MLLTRPVALVLKRRLTGLLALYSEKSGCQSTSHRQIMLLTNCPILQLCLGRNMDPKWRLTRLLALETE